MLSSVKQAYLSKDTLQKKVRVLSLYLQNGRSPENEKGLLESSSWGMLWQRSFSLSIFCIHLLSIKQFWFRHWCACLLLLPFPIVFLPPIELSTMLWWIWVGEVRENIFLQQWLGRPRDLFEIQRTAIFPHRAAISTMIQAWWPSRILLFALSQKTVSASSNFFSRDSFFSWPDSFSTSSDGGPRIFLFFKLSGAWSCARGCCRFDEDTEECCDEKPSLVLFCW